MICTRHGSADIGRDARRHSEGARARVVVRRNRTTAGYWVRDRQSRSPAAARDGLDRATSAWWWEPVADNRRGTSGDAAARSRRRNARRDSRRARGGAQAWCIRRNVGVFGAASTAPARLLSKKKSFVATERDTPEHAIRRAAYLKFIDGFCPTKLVYIDESFCKTGMRREYSWAPLGERAVGKRPFRSWKTLSLISAIRLGSRPTLMTHEGAVNGRVFLDFIQRRLLPRSNPAMSSSWTTVTVRLGTS